MNSSSTNGEQPLPPKSEPLPLHGLPHTMLNGETLKIWATPDFVEALKREAPHLLAFVQGYKPIPLTDRQERELYRASFRRLIQEPLRARRRGWCATPPLD